MQEVDAAGLAIGDGYPSRIMGVVNVSVESPYQPSVFDDPGEAATYIDRDLIDEGADIVDVGLASANKRVEVLSPEEELERLDAAVDAIASTSGDAVFSIETRYHEVAEAALGRGFDAVNDVCGFADPEMPRVCADHDVAVVKMASPPDRTRPGAVIAGTDTTNDVDYPDAVYEALGRNGFTEKTIIDPAFGGWSERKTLADDRATFRRLREFRGYGRPVLVSINRKNFLRLLVDRSTEAALPASLAAMALAVDRGVHILRTHDVAETRDAARIADTFAPQQLRDDALGVYELDVRTPGEVRRHAARLGVDPATADRTIVRTFEITGLDRATRKELAGAAADHQVTFATGSGGSVLAGTTGSLAELTSADLEEHAAAILDRIAGAL